MAECALRADAHAAGMTNVEDDGLCEPKTRGGYGGAALQFFLPYATTKAAEVLTMAWGSGVLAMSEADYSTPGFGALIDRWLIDPNTTGYRRMQLMKLAWDMTGTEFGSRAELYERLYSGDPERNGMNWFAHPITKECEALVDRLLASRIRPAPGAFEEETTPGGSSGVVVWMAPTRARLRERPARREPQARRLSMSSATSTIMSSWPPTMRRLPSSTRMSTVFSPYFCAAASVWRRKLEYTPA